MKTVIVGDSLTAGMPGVSYWKFLNHKSSVMNKGLCGDTLQGAVKRISKMTACSKYDSVGRYIIQIGTNDVLLPVLKKHSYCWYGIVKIRERLFGSIPCDDITVFKEKYERLIVTLLKHHKIVGIIGLPMIENSLLKINDTMYEYHIVVRELAKKYKLDYVNLRALQIKVKGKNKGTYFYGKTNMLNFTDTILTSFLPFSDAVSSIRGLAVTVDGVHLRRKTAKLLAEQVEQNLFRRNEKYEIKKR